MGRLTPLAAGSMMPASGHLSAVPDDAGAQPPQRRVYLAGPMTGHQSFNFPAFTAAAADLRLRGYEVVSPHEQPLPAGVSQTELTYEQAMALDLPLVCQSDAVVVLPGWESSRGCSIEVSVARQLDIEVLAYPDLDPIVEPAPTWRSETLDEANRLVNGDRNASYGPPTQDFERTAAMWAAWGFRFMAADGTAMPTTARHVAVAMILLKMSRLAHAPKADSWVDTAGYAACGRECDELLGA